jgi:hypothetical protein
VIPKDELHDWFLKYCKLVGTTEAEWTIRRFNSELKKTIPEFKNTVHDKTCRVDLKGCKVWYDTRFKGEEYKAFEQEGRIGQELRAWQKTCDIMASGCETKLRSGLGTSIQKRSFLMAARPRLLLGYGLEQ